MASRLLNFGFYFFILGFVEFSFAQYGGQMVEDEYGNQYKLVDPNRPGRLTEIPILRPETSLNPILMPMLLGPKTPLGQRKEHWKTTPQRRKDVSSKSKTLVGKPSTTCRAPWHAGPASPTNNPFWKREPPQRKRSDLQTSGKKWNKGNLRFRKSSPGKNKRN